MGNLYAGESYSKRIARAIVYAELVDGDFWKRISNDSSLVITLTGDEAAEAGIFKRLGARPEQCLFVDLRSANTETARTRWPGTNAITADVVQVLEAIPSGIPVGLVHLDFMGHYGQSVRDALLACARRISCGGYAIWTFLRGRETEANPFWKLAKSRVREQSDLNLEPEAWEVRRSGYASLATEALNSKLDARGPLFRVVGMVDYDSGKSPMGMIVFKKMSPVESERKRKELDGIFRKGNNRQRFDGIYQALPIATLRGDAKKYLRWKLCCPCASCFGATPAGVLSDFYNISQATIAAWRAHFTMGTYENEKQSFSIIKQKKMWRPCPGCASAAERSEYEAICHHRDQQIIESAPRSKYTRRGIAARKLNA